MPESPTNENAAPQPIESDGLAVSQEGSVAPGTEGADHNGGCAQEATPEATTGRRQLFVAAGAAALGAVGVSLLEASPAGATTGNMQFGTINNAGLSATELDSSSNLYTLLVTNSSSGNSSGAALSVGETSSTSEAIAMSVIQQGLNFAIFAEVANADNVNAAIRSITLGTASALEAIVSNPGSGAAAVSGSTNGSGPGILGQVTNASAGVLGQNAGTGSGVEGQISNGSSTAPAVLGTTNGIGSGVEGQITNAANNDAAVFGTTIGTGAGVLGVNTGTGLGVAGQILNAASAAAAIVGTTNGIGAGVEGQVTNAASSASAVLGTTNGTGAGVHGTTSGAGAGVSGLSTSGYGVSAQGGKAPILLTPAATAGPPTGTHVAGELYVDSNGVFYRCVAPGSPGTWVPMYSVVPLLAPVRVLSTPSGVGNTGGLTGPFNPDGTTHTTSVLTGGVTGIPPLAVGVVANLAISGNGATLNGNGFLTLFPAGTANPGTASINCGGDAFATSNGVTVAFGTGGNAGKLSFSWQGGGGPLPCQVFLDVTAYIL